MCKCVLELKLEQRLVLCLIYYFSIGFIPAQIVLCALYMTENV